MEEKALLKFKTAIPFPLLVYKTNVRYNEVRKASGVAFILLDVIEKTANSEDRICDVLLKFGIPRDLHYIFGKEISGLIGTEILFSDYPTEHFMNPKYFAEIKVNEVSLTAKGKKMFREGAIPTGEEKVKIKDIFYSPVTRKFDVSFTLPYTSLDSSVLYEDIESFLDKTIDISGLKDYVEANTTKVGLKAEERVVDVEIPEKGDEKQVRKEDGAQVTINKNGVEFSFETSDEAAYFNKWYSSPLMTKCLLAKEKYKFVDMLKNAVVVPTIELSELRDIVGAYIPNDVSKQAKRPCKIFIDNGSLATDRTDDVLKTDKTFSRTLLDKVDKNAAFALLDLSALRYYSALNVKMPCKQLGDTFEMQLLTENVADEALYRKTVKAIFEKYIQMPFDEDVAKVVMFTVNALKEASYFAVATEKQFESAKNTDEKINLLLKLNDVFAKSTEWQPYFNSVATSLLSDSVSEIKIDNVIYKSTILNPLRKVLGLSDFDYVQKFAITLIASEDDEIVYEALVGAGFTIECVLSVVNVVENFAEKAVSGEENYSDTDLGNVFHNIGYNLRKLNEMLGIESLAEYAIKDDFNEEEFFNTYATLKAAIKSVEKYAKYAPKPFDSLKRYMAIYEPIHETLSIERATASHPEKITKKYIDDNINRGKYKEAVCDLFVKLQYDLREILNADSMTSAHDLLVEARNKGIIDGKQESVLHKLRMCRNGFQHPERSQVQVNKEMVQNWLDTVFAVKGEQK